MEESNKLEQQSSTEVVKQPQIQNKEIITDSSVTPLHDQGGGYVEYDNKLYQLQALKELKPDLFRLVPDYQSQSSTNFGTQFPRIAKKGDIFVRVDVLPNRVFKFDGRKWLEQDKRNSQSYLDNRYVEFLISKLDSGEYDPELLTEYEKTEIESHLSNQKT